MTSEADPAAPATGKDSPLCGPALAWGILVFAGFCVGLLPCLGWLNWITVPSAYAGMVVNIVALVKTRHRTPPAAVAGLLLSLIAAKLGLLRLLVGGGLL